MCVSFYCRACWWSLWRFHRCSSCIWCFARCYCFRCCCPDSKDNCGVPQLPFFDRTYTFPVVVLRPIVVRLADVLVMHSCWSHRCGLFSVCFPRFLVQALSCPALHHGVHYLVQGVLRAARGLQTFRLIVPRLSHAYNCFRWSSILASMCFAVWGFCSRVGGHISRVVGHSSGVGDQSPRVGRHSPSVVFPCPW